jgi:hypothetical protein
MNAVSTASPSPVHEAVAATHALCDSYVEQNAKAIEPPVMTKAEIDRLVLRGLVERPLQPPPPVDHPAKAPTPAGQKKMGKPRRALASYLANKARAEARYEAKKQLPLVATKQPEIWNTAKLHEEVTEIMRENETERLT